MTIHASELLGSAVVDREGDRVGRIEDLILDVPGAANICYALVHIEQPTEPRQRMVAVPWSLLERRSQSQLVLGISRQALGRLKNLGGQGPSGR
ncbi:PRC-barrel domain-containing protein [Wenzhouxiangella sp. XN24]|uniref:PRC-barrel domain-containing protein n=1 Tax=Wenzhouxiangella sp. XN24 TaxID=2713569 RepID=UPI0013EA900F|nr:PRC-barrel domain-containing protein [Wenzhouxiangella sp. XN24]NGX15025.1 PRC-barrel domain containing protein [Wenzhouxiangella sp. XN24]